MRNQGIGSWTARRARKTPDRTALVLGDRAASYAGLHERATRLAHVLRARGVGRGDRVAYLGPNHPAYLETLFATGDLGGVFVPLNSRLADPELVFQLTDSGSSVLVHAGRGAETLRAVHAGPHRARAVAVGDPVPADLPYDALVDDASAEPVDEAVEPRRPLPDHVHLRHDRAAQGRDAHPRQHHLERVNVLVDVDLVERRGHAGRARRCSTPQRSNMLCLPTMLKGGTRRAGAVVRRRRGPWS